MSHRSESDGDQHKAWSMARDIGTCMYITSDGEKHRARPMAAYVEEDEHAFYFLTDADSAKAWQTEADHAVTLAFSEKSNHVVISGRGIVTDDRAKIADLWNHAAKAWWDSPDDPAIRLIKVSPEEAEYWDAPNGPVATIKMLAAAATNHQPDMGENAKVRL